MTPINFKHVNMKWAENQDEYLTLPAYTDGRETISCWRLTFKDRIKALFLGKLWLRQLNFGQSLQPQALTFDYPFLKESRDGYSST